MAKQFEVEVDVVLLSAFDEALWTLVRRRTGPPFRRRYELPGGFLQMQESLDAAARRVLRENTGVDHVNLEQLYTLGAPRRDPRGRVISVAYYGLVPRGRLPVQDAFTLARLRVTWEGQRGGAVGVEANGTTLGLAFDHADILGMAVKRVRGKLEHTPIGFQLLPQTFTLLDLQRIHETVLRRPLNKDSFRRRMLASGQLQATGEAQRAVYHRPAELYRFAGSSEV
jgi:8-oxo-dGTP diphosphatase